MSVRVCVLGSGSRGNSTLVVTEKTRLLVDAGFSKKETYARLSAVGETASGCAALIISHEHSDHITGLKGLALDLKVPVYISAETRAAIQWDARITCIETISAGEKFTVGDIEVTPFSIPHDAADPVGFTFRVEGAKVSLATDLGYLPVNVRDHLRGSDVLIMESNHDVEMLRGGP